MELFSDKELPHEAVIFVLEEFEAESEHLLGCYKNINCIEFSRYFQAESLEPLWVPKRCFRTRGEMRRKEKNRQSNQMKL